MSNHIPEELVVEILIHLPPKSLLRFKSVCKSWYNLISHPNFVTRHQISSPQKLIIRSYDAYNWSEHYALSRDDAENESFGTHMEELVFPLRAWLGYFRIVGCCDGVLCLYDDLFANTNQNVVLWNPSVRKSVKINLPPMPVDQPHMVVLGFGVCPVTRDVKLVRIVYLKNVLHFSETNSETRVFSLSLGTWRKVSMGAPPYRIVEFSWSQVFVSGVIYWIAHGWNAEGENRNVVITFSLVDEVFGVLKLPEVLERDSVSNLSIARFGESLSVSQYNRESDETTSCVWVSGLGVSGTWSKLLNIRQLGGIYRTVGFRKNGDVILSMKNMELVSYEPNTGCIKNLGIVGNGRSFYLDTFVESLVLQDAASELPVESQNSFASDESATDEGEYMEDSVDEELYEVLSLFADMLE